jgi:ATP-dependent DNA ligase
MEAELVRTLPEDGDWQYEPKWDGFRGVLENLEGELHLWSRNARPLLRYFPELAELGERLPAHSAVDGEIVIERDGVLEFDSLQMRLHPAESRIRKLSAEIPAGFVLFDVLLWDGEELHRRPLSERRTKVEALPFDVSPASQNVADARAWLERLEVAGFDGVIAKRLELPYLPGSRDRVLKVKAHRTADCIVVGVRWKEKGAEIATLLLGLYDDAGELHYVGAASAAARGRRAEIEERVLPLLGPAPLREPPGQPSRWRPKQELEWSSVKPELVVEVRYDKWQGARFRHGTRFLRFRPDKDPEQCTFAQVRPRPTKGDPTVSGLLGRDG